MRRVLGDEADVEAGFAVVDELGEEVQVAARQAERDRAEREAQLQLITDALARLPEDRDGHTRAACALVAHRSLGRCLKTDARGRPSIDKANVKAEARLDGKSLVRTSDEQLSATDIAEVNTMTDSQQSTPPRPCAPGGAAKGRSANRLPTWATEIS